MIHRCSGEGGGSVSRSCRCKEASRKQQDVKVDRNRDQKEWASRRGVETLHARRGCPGFVLQNIMTLPDKKKKRQRAVSERGSCIHE